VDALARAHGHARTACALRPAPRSPRPRNRAGVSTRLAQRRTCPARSSHYCHPRTPRMTLSPSSQARRAHMATVIDSLAMRVVELGTKECTVSVPLAARHRHEPSTHAVATHGPEPHKHGTDSRLSIARCHQPHRTRGRKRRAQHAAGCAYVEHMVSVARSVPSVARARCRPASRLSQPEQGAAETT
jgi:hypothetical protein